MSFARPLALAVVLVLCASPTIASAATPEDEAGAERLFQEAKALLAAGRVPEGCSKLVEAKRLELGGGIVLALAVCHQKEGRGASALADFREALALAVAAKRVDRMKLAEEQIAQLEAHVSTLTVVAPEGASVRVNGELRDAGSLGVPVPVDGGDYVVRAEMPGRKGWATTLHVAAEGDAQRVEIPALAEMQIDPAFVPVALAPAPDALVQKRSAQEREARTRRIAGLVVGGAGVLGLGVGGALGALALIKRNDSDCGGNLCPGAGGTYSSAQTTATAATVTSVAGGVALAAGVALFLSGRSSGSSPTASVKLRPSLSPNGASLAIEGRF